MKRTSDDREFAVKFGEALMYHYRKASSNGTQVSDEQFASTLDVSRPALKKYLKGSATPSLRVLVLAFLRYGVNVPYFGVNLFPKKRSHETATEEPKAQLILPFAVQGLNVRGMQTKIEAKGVNRFELRVDFDKLA